MPARLQLPTLDAALKAPPLSYQRELAALLNQCGADEASSRLRGVRRGVLQRAVTEGVRLRFGTGYALSALLAGGTMAATEAPAISIKTFAAPDQSVDRLVEAYAQQLNMSCDVDSVDRDVLSQVVKRWVPLWQAAVGDALLARAGEGHTHVTATMLPVCGTPSMLDAAFDDLQVWLGYGTVLKSFYYTHPPPLPPTQCRTSAGVSPIPRLKRWYPVQSLVAAALEAQWHHFK